MSYTASPHLRLFGACARIADEESLGDKACCTLSARERPEPSAVALCGLIIWKIEITGQWALDLFGLGRGILKTEFSPDGSLLAVVGSNSNVALYDVATATPRLVPRRVPPS